MKQIETMTKEYFTKERTNFKPTKTTEKMSDSIEEFLKKYRKENNTDPSIYSSYHLDFAEAYAAEKLKERDNDLIHEREAAIRNIMERNGLLSEWSRAEQSDTLNEVDKIDLLERTEKAINPPKTEKG